MNYEETLTFLFEKLPMFQRVGKTAFKKDLTNTLKLMEVLGDPHLGFRSVHIAGTNGKGSTAHSIASVLMNAGYKTGLYTSPHLKSFTERIKIDGEDIQRTYVIDFVERIRPSIEDIQPSFFEITVAMAFDYFANSNIDIAIVEVGMGGRFDSTNVIKPELSVITSIGLDHQEFLGNDLASIAFEKAGIIKQNTPVIISKRNEETDPVFLKRAKEDNSKIYFAQDDVSIRMNKDGNFNVESDFYSGDIDFDLTGNYQKYNLPGIIKALQILNAKGFQIENNHIKKGLSQVVACTGLKGRWQSLREKPYVICDTGHNQDGIQQIIDQIKTYSFEKLWMVMGFVNDKDLEKIFELLPKNASYIFCQAKIPRAKKVEEVLDLAKEYHLNAIAIPDVNDAYNKAVDLANENDFVFIGGSTFVVAEIEDL